MTRAPSSTQSRRYGRFDPLVIGAMTTAPGRASRRFTPTSRAFGPSSHTSSATLKTCGSRFGVAFPGLLVASAPAPAQANGRKFLWLCKAGRGPPTYLMGSLHVLTGEYYPLSLPSTSAFADSKVLVEEVDIDR